MTVDVEKIVTWGIYGIGWLVTMIGLYYSLRSDIKEVKTNIVVMEKDRLEDREKLLEERDSRRSDLDREILRIKDVNKLQWEKLDDVLKWQSAHEKEAWGNRNTLELKISTLDGKHNRLESMFESITEKLDQMGSDIREIKKSNDDHG